MNHVRNIRHIGFGAGDYVQLLPTQPMLRPDPWKGKDDPSIDKIFNRSCFTESEYQQYVKRRNANV